MRRIEKTVFISYRRDDEMSALSVYMWLRQHGFDVFIDYLSLGPGAFDREIAENIRSRAHFLVLLTPTALDRVDQPGDWLRREVELAIDSGRNIVPLMLEGFDFDRDEVKQRLSGKLAQLKGYNGLAVPKGFFEPAMERLEKQFLDVAIDTVVHPASDAALESVSRQQLAADKAAQNLASPMVAGQSEAALGERGSTDVVEALPAAPTGAQPVLTLRARIVQGGSGESSIELSSTLDGSDLRGVAPNANLARNLIRSGSRQPRSDPQTGRTLFKTLVPPQLQRAFDAVGRVTLEVDEATAGIPWELLDSRPPGDEQSAPWAVRAGLLRAMRTTEFAPTSIQPAAESSVLVVAEPAVTSDFYRALPGAYMEGKAVFSAMSAALAQQRIRAELLLQTDGLTIMNALLARRHAIVHLCGHGEMVPKPALVLSDDVFLGATEICAMPGPPELVFVNACHLGPTPGAELLAPLEYSRFAASFAEELLTIGVRCVVAAGWHIDDESSKVFAEIFYRDLIGGATFADATANARGAAWRAGGGTWGAYQCYGDPAWRISLEPVKPST